MSRFAAVLFLVLAMAFPSVPQEGPRTDPEIEKAVARAAEWLKKQPSIHYTELVLWAFLNAGLDEGDPAFKERLKVIQDKPANATYQTALRALLYAKLDPVRFAPQLRACAQFLADTQGDGGVWSYAREYQVSVDRERKADVKLERTAPQRKCRGEPEEFKPVLNEEIQPGAGGGAGGDNSNTQFAALGLWACWKAGLRFPAGFVRRAKSWWENCQNGDGGWGYGAGGQVSYGSMTAAGVSALIIYRSMLGEEVKGDPCIENGLKWMDRHFAVGSNPGGGPRWQYYWLYGVERVGILLGTDKIGGHAWFEKGVRQLLSTQKPDGSWAGGGEPALTATPFAILFLKRATLDRRIVLPRKREVKKDSAPARNELVFAQIGVREQGDPVVPDYEKVIAGLRKRLGAEVRDGRVPVSLVDDRLENYPFLYLTGHEAQEFSDREVQALAGHLRRGGMLYIQNCCRSAAFEKSVRKLAPRLFNQPLAPVPADDSLYAKPADIRKVVALEGVRLDGRWVVVYCAEDVCCGWGGEACDDGCCRLGSEPALDVVSNIVSAAFSE